MKPALILLMANKKKKQKRTASTKKTTQAEESDSTYILKLALYLIVGSLWVRISFDSGNGQIPIPIGFIIGLLFAMQDRFNTDRKIEYALLLVAMFIGFWLPIGVIFSI